MDIIKKLLVISICAGFALCLAACGKSSPPRPPGGVQEFHWTWTRAEIVNDCLSIQGGMEGNMDTFYEVVLELQPSDTEDFCAGCPFLPVERESFSRRESDFQLEQSGDGGYAQSATISILYCPDRKTPAYQWRLLGVNVNQVIPHALTPIQYITSPLFLE